MKKLFLIGFFLIGCSDLDNGGVDVSIGGEGGGGSGSVGHPVGVDGGSAVAPICNGKSEMRRVEINGEVHYLSVPIDCVDKWQAPEDPVNSKEELFLFEQEVLKQ